MKISDIEVDPVKVEEGEWIGNLPELLGVRLRVKGLGCEEFRRTQSDLIDQVPRNRRVDGKLSVKDQDMVTNACLHRVILLDWDGMEDDSGNAQPYDKALALTYLTEPRYRKFRDGVVAAANRVGETRAEALKADLGNSVPSSTGS